MFRFLFDIDTWQELKESLTKNKLRTVITMIGVWWGILLLIGLLGSAKGIENKFSVQFGDYATNSVFIFIFCNKIRCIPSAITIYRLAFF